MKSQVVPLSRDEMDALLIAVDEKLYWKVLFVFAKTTGRRLGEVYALRVKDIDFHTGLAIMDIEKSFKRHRKQINDDGTWTELPPVNLSKVKRLETVILPNVAVLLKRYIKEKGLKAEDYVFREKSYRQIQARIKSFARKAGIAHNVSFHNFRHYFITELVRKGWSHDRITKLTGHANTNTIQIYDHCVASDLKEEALKDIE